MPNLNVYFTEAELQQLIKAKAGKTWRDFIMSKNHVSIITVNFPNMMQKDVNEVVKLVAELLMKEVKREEAGNK